MLPFSFQTSWKRGFVRNTSLLARLGSRPSLKSLQPELFHSGPDLKDAIEFCGQEGTGKTEMLLYLVSSIILPKSWGNVELNGADAGVIFIDNDYKFSMLRLVTHMERRINTAVCDSSNSLNTACPDPEDIEEFIKGCLSKFLLVRCSSSTQLIITLHSLHETLSNEPNIAMLMIDSISAFYWLDKCSGGEMATAQESNMKLVVEILTKLIYDFNLVLVATKAALFQRKVKEESWNLDCGSPIDTKKRKLESYMDSNYAQYLCKEWQRLVKHRFIFERDKKYSAKNTAKINITCNSDGRSLNTSFYIDENKLYFNPTVKGSSS